MPKLLSIEEMATRPQEFFPISGEFQAEALQSTVAVITGNIHTFHLYFVAEWDERRVLVGYAREVALLRRQAGLEEWFLVQSLVQPDWDTPGDPQAMTRREVTDKLLAVGRQAQEILDAARPDEPLQRADMERVRALLGTAWHAEKQSPFVLHV